MSTEGDGSVPTPAWRGVGTLDLEDLLGELRARASSAQHSHERMSDLLEAVVAVSADLDLPEVLARIVQSAISLVDCRYGALGVVGPDGEHLVEFITRGVTAEERARIGELPRGHGILGLLIRDPRPRRLRDLATHPDSFGFPPHHPEMHSFLGVPIRIRDTVFGNLYLAEKLGSVEFTAEDEVILIALAAAAGVAIDNARMYEAGRRQAEWVEAVAEITKMLLEREDEAAATRLMTEQAARLGGASHVILALHDDSDELVVRDVCRVAPDPVHLGPDRAFAREALSGDHWTRLRGIREPVLLPALPPASTPIGDADTNPDTDADINPVTDADTKTGAAPGPVNQWAMRADLCRLADVAPATPLAVLPLSPGRGDLGVLAVAWVDRDESAPLDTLPILTEYARQAGLALLAGRAQRDRARMALLDDRDRIARDMHDHVIQRLFATGLSLQSAARVAQHPMVQGRLDEAVDELDVAIKEIRHAIFELHQPPPSGSVHRDLEDLAASFTDGLGFAADLVVEGPVARLNSSLCSDVMAVVREGLSNVTRHARATRAGVRVHVDREGVGIEVSDDGVGVGPIRTRSGLANIGDRAAAASGTFDVSHVEPSGTLLRWRAPLDPG